MTGINENTGGRMKRFWWERDLLILTSGMYDSFKIDSEMQDEKRKITRFGRDAENYDSNQVGSR